MPTSLDLTKYAPGTFEAMDDVDLSTISEEDLVFVRTDLGSAFRIQVNPMVASDNAKKINIFIATLPQEFDHPQHADRVIEVGKPWHYNAGNPANITSIYRVRPAA